MALLILIAVLAVALVAALPWENLYAAWLAQRLRNIKHDSEQASQQQTNRRYQ